MNYGFSKTLDMPFEQAIEKVTEELKKEGFGVLTSIDVKETLKNKLDVDFKKYLILGACNPPYAYEAIIAEDKIGTMLPCNVVVTETHNGLIEVAAIDPLISMEGVANKDLLKIAVKINQKLKIVIKNI